MNTAENMAVLQDFPDNCAEIVSNVREQVTNQVGAAENCDNGFKSEMVQAVYGLHNRNFDKYLSLSKFIEGLRSQIDAYNEKNCMPVTEVDRKMVIAEAEFGARVEPYGQAFYQYYSPFKVTLFKLSNSGRFEIQVQSQQIMPS
jgi:hypothetical protein